MMDRNKRNTTDETMRPDQDAMNRDPRAQTMDGGAAPAGRTATAPTARQETDAARQERRGPSTADLASAMEQRDTNGASGPKYVEGEETRAARTGGAGSDARSTPLFPQNQVEHFRSQWTEIQTGFVDDPRQVVERADQLVAEVIKGLAEGFARERNQLEQQWDRGDNVDTESLRVALQRYRSFFERLLSA
jgi:hypothetical protein